MSLNFVLFDDELNKNFYPFTLTRPISAFQTGIFTNKQRWEKVLKASFSTLAPSHLKNLFPTEWGDDNLVINSRVFPNESIIKEIHELQPEETLFKEDLIVAFRTQKPLQNIAPRSGKKKNHTANIAKLENVWDFFTKASEIIDHDFNIIKTIQKKSIEIPSNVNSIEPNKIFIEEGAKLNFCSLNATNGPIYIGKNTEVMEGATIRGPFVLGENSQLKMGAKIYGGTIIGPGCKVGGEVSNSVFFGNSNKGHDGFIGNAVIGHWCNLGAGSTNSNLKNDYANVKIWSESKKEFIDTELQFCGLFLGDHSKSAINTSFNTGTIAGPHANIFTTGLTDKLIKPFTWGNEPYQTEKAINTAKRVLERRQTSLTDADIELINYLSKQQQNGC